MLKHKEITEKIIGAFYNVYNELGKGFLESVYENALKIELELANLKVSSQENINVKYKGIIVGEFRPDIIVNDSVIIELKAISTLRKEHEAQILNYLKATEIEVGILLNFGDTPKFKRFIYGKK
ncbi:GxxExxY protein [candidate division KSB1 bacterium]|nr:GxxExxY protein [candidate division KSB1 bacterium]